MQAYDQHLNMVLGNVEETLTTREISEETAEEIVKVKIKRFKRTRQIQKKKPFFQKQKTTDNKKNNGNAFHKRRWCDLSFATNTFVNCFLIKKKKSGKEANLSHSSKFLIKN